MTLELLDLTSVGRIDLAGAADLHCYFGPDAHRERSVSAIEAARDALIADHAAIVLKSHDCPTAVLASAVDDVVPGIDVYGGICCEREVGGINPAAVEAALRLGAKIVWLPTVSSLQDYQSGAAAKLGIPGPGIPTCDPESGQLLYQTNEVMALVAQYDAILATGHISAYEHYAVAKTFARKGKLVVTHAMEELVGPNLTIEQCVDLAGLGATIELAALTCVGTLATRSPEQIAACIRAVGPEHVTLATAYGQKANARPARGLSLFAEALLDEGLDESTIRRMACTNPRALLGLPA
ncbi:MAG: DUF6282 family protein [Acidimicrobiia bacterium]